MVIIETPTFTRLIRALLNDEEYRALQEVLVTRPEIGDLIKGSGGLRKIRWSQNSKGKQGGVRVLYYWVVSDDQIYMLYACAKGRQVDLGPEQLKQLKMIVERW